MKNTDKQLNLNSLSIEQLKCLKTKIKNSKKSVIISEIENTIEDKKAEELNRRFTLNMFLEYNILSSVENRILNNNNINNLQELIDADLSKIVDDNNYAIDEGLKRTYKWVREWYDMRPKQKVLVKNNEKNGLLTK